MADITAFGRGLPVFTSGGVTLQALAPEGVLHLRLIGGEAAQGAAVERLLGPLPGPLASQARAQHTLLWLAPGQWLLLLPRAELPTRKGELETALAGQGLAADWSDQLVPISLQGALWRDVLAAGSTVDFDASHFPVGRVTRTSLGRVETIVWRQAEDRVLLLFERSMARYAWLWLETVGRQIAALAQS